MMMETNPTPFISVKVDSDLIDIFPEYLRKRKLDLANIPHLIQRNDFASVRSMGHQLHGNAALFGLDWLGERGAELEKVAQAGQIEEVIRLGQAMSDFLEKVVLEAE